MEERRIKVSVLYGLHVLREQADAYIYSIMYNEVLFVDFFGRKAYVNLLQRKEAELLKLDTYFENVIERSQMDAFNYGPMSDIWSDMNSSNSVKSNMNAIAMLIFYERTVLEWCSFVLEEAKMDVGEMDIFLEIALASHENLIYVLSDC